MRKKYLKGLTITTLVASLLFTSGCGKAEHTPTSADGTENLTTVDETETTDFVDESESTDDEMLTDVTDSTEQMTENLDVTDDVSFMTTEGFNMISLMAEEYVFEREYSDDEDISPYYRQVTFTSQCPLSEEQFANIKVFCDVENCIADIEINDEKVMLNIGNIVDVWIADVDIHDSYKEIVLVDAGPSDDWTICLVRYVDGKIYVYETILGNPDQVLINEEGHILGSTGYIDFLDTQIVTGYYEIKDEKIIYEPVDKSGALNQKYKLSRDIVVAYKDSIDAHYDLESLIELHEGDEILLIEANPLEYEYYVELPDGRIGYITTHVAG